MAMAICRAHLHQQFDIISVHGSPLVRAISRVPRVRFGVISGMEHADLNPSATNLR